MASNNTISTMVDVLDFIQTIKSEKKIKDAQRLLTIMESISGYKAVIVGSKHN